MADCRMCLAPYSLGNTKYCFDCLANMGDEEREAIFRKSGFAQDEEKEKQVIDKKVYFMDWCFPGAKKKRGRKA